MRNCVGESLYVKSLKTVNDSYNWDVGFIEDVDRFNERPKLVSYVSNEPSI
jgi:hypothetical protein